MRQIDKALFLSKRADTKNDFSFVTDSTRFSEKYLSSNRGFVEENKNDDEF